MIAERLPLVYDAFARQYGERFAWVGARHARAISMGDGSLHLYTARLRKHDVDKGREFGERCTLCRRKINCGDAVAIYTSNNGESCDIPDWFVITHASHYEVELR